MMTIIHPNGLMLARGERDGMLSVCQIATSTLLWSTLAHQRNVTVLAWSPDGNRLASGGRDGQVHVWHAETGEKLGSFSHGRAVQHLRWSWDAERLVASSGSCIHTWTPPPASFPPA